MSGQRSGEQPGWELTECCDWPRGSADSEEEWGTLGRAAVDPGSQE